MATPNNLATNAVRFGDTGPASSTNGILGRERSEYGVMLLEEFYRMNIYLNFMSERYTEIIPGGSGSEIAQWFEYPGSPAMAALTEGQPPNPIVLPRNRVTKQVKQRGGWYQLTDIERSRSAHNLPGVVTDKLMRGFMEDNDQLARDALYLTGTPASGNFPTGNQGGNVGGSHDNGNKVTNVTYGGTATAYTGLTTDSSGGNFTLAKIRGMVERLESNNVPKLLPRIFASPLIATQPGPPCYIGVTDNVGRGILRGLTTGTGADARFRWQEPETYSQQEAIMPGEVGRTGDVRWIYSELTAWAGTGTTKGTGRRLAILGQDAFGMAGISTERMNVLTTSLEPDKGDPLGQVSSVGIKYSVAYSILNPTHVEVLYYTTA